VAPGLDGSAVGHLEEIKEDRGQEVVVRFRERDGSEERVKPLIVLDDVIVSDPDFLENVDKESIDRIEVIKGAAAEQLYGERAAGGVIKIFTKR
jgi:hypothetical protein